MNIPINLVFEDEISEFIMIKILNSFGNKFYLGNSYSEGGFGYIKVNIGGFNQAAITTPFFILTDLDNFPCPIDLIEKWLPKSKSSNLIFRIAIKEVEAWLIADIEGFSNFTGVSKDNFPDNPELEPDPKRTLINLVKKSKKRKIKEDIIPINNNAKIGPNYNERLMEFVSDYWDLKRAMDRSESLHRAYIHLQRYQYNSLV